MRARALCAVYTFVAVSTVACSSQQRKPRVDPAPPPPRAPRTAVVEEPTRLEPTEPYRATLTAMRGAVLYIPTWFSAREGGYDLMVHFHGLGKIQEANIERSQLDVAVVSINIGVGTAPYAKAFAKPERFPRVLAEAQEEIEKSGRVPNAKMRRLALSAWSAGFVSIAAVMRDASVAQRVDAIVLADGFYTAFVNVKRRVVNPQGIEPFARFADAAGRDEKLFAITHTTIPTGRYPSVQECVAKLLEMTSNAKVPSKGTGPREMQEIYTVDHGSFHVRGYEGRTAKDHVLQINAMGETLYPYLKARWAPKPGEHKADATPPAKTAEGDAGAPAALRPAP